MFYGKFAEPRRIFNYYMENNEELESILIEGENKAREIAQETIGKVRKVLGFSS
jgi:tryptophanyl-tRNA synthetase